MRRTCSSVIVDGMGPSTGGNDARTRHITEPGGRGVDLLFLSPDDSVLALEVKGTLRVDAIPRLTPSRLRQVSREWLKHPGNPAMTGWDLEADDLYAGVMVVDLAKPAFRVALSRDFETSSRWDPERCL